MRKSKFCETQIHGILKGAVSGVAVSQGTTSRGSASRSSPRCGKDFRLAVVIVRGDSRHAPKSGSA